MNWFLSLGWFWKFWIISSVVCVLVIITLSMSIEASIKRKYSVKEQKYALSEHIAALLPALIPFYNVLVAISAIIFVDKAKDRILEQYRKDGRLEEK